MRAPFTFTAAFAVLCCWRCFDDVERTSGNQKYCADCVKEARAERDKRRRLENPERHRTNFRRWYEKNTARVLENNRRWRAARRHTTSSAPELKQQLSEERSSSSFEFAAA